MAAPTIIAPDPAITVWFGLMSIDWTYAPPESTWGGGYDWGDAACSWGNGIDTVGNWGFDMDYDLINDGNWVTCLLLNGSNASDADIDAFAWNQFHTSWDIAGQSIDDSDNCKIRCRIKNRNTAIYSDYGYYGPVGIRAPGIPMLIGFGTGVSYRWQPSSPSDYPQNILQQRSNVARSETPTGRVQVIKHAKEERRFEINFPCISSADLTDLQSFLEKVDYRANPFIYRDKEVAMEDPFAGSWKSYWVKLEDIMTDITYLRGESPGSPESYTVKLGFRRTEQRAGLFAEDVELN